MKAPIAARLRGTKAAEDPEAVVLASMPASHSARLFPNGLQRAAVLLPLIDRPTGLTVLLTLRSERLRDHPGQVSLPGGRMEETDASPLATALREFEEELGIPREMVDIMGYLPPQAVISGFVITPVVGMLPPAITVQPDSTEVAEAFEVPLNFLLDSGNEIASLRRIQDVEIRMVEYHYAGHRIWGATAQILQSLIKVI
jgi:8-oxo-dGTP pyrophosphatase MutT (NUDIX family)